MASLSRDSSGSKRLLYVDPQSGDRKTLYLGKLPVKAAETIKHHLEVLLACKTSGAAWPQPTAQWVAELPDGLAGKLAKAGLMGRRQSETLGVFLARWLDGRRDYKPTSRVVWGQVVRDLLGFFGKDRPLAGIGHEAAEAFRQHLVERRLRPTTINKRLQHCRMFFKHAMREALIGANPFEHVQHRGGNVAERRAYVSREDIMRVIDRCPDVHWRVLVALARFAGLRTPSESFSLRWQNIDWAEGRMVIHSPKTEHLAGGDSRAVPLFAELRPFLEAAWELAPEGAVYVVPEDLRRRALGPHGWRNANLRTRLAKIVRRAGLQPWPRLWHSLRASCETDLVRKYPLPVVAKWLGNTSMVAMRHYVDVTDEHFRQAAAEGLSEAAQNPTQNPTQQGAAQRSILRKLPTQPIPQFDSLQRLATPFCSTHPSRVEDRGLEPLAF